VGGFRSVVAIKLLHNHLATDKHFKKMFIEEAKVGAVLNHRCLLNVMDYGEEEGVSYIVTEYFPSASLEQLVEKKKKVPLAEALYVLAEGAEGLGALHLSRDIDNKRRMGLVHRDISPHNILIGHDGRVKIIDYGIIKKEDPTEKTRAGLVKGKLRYMSPEQACGGPVGPASDLYSLGAAFLRCVTGQKPHGAGNTAEIMARARTGVDYAELTRKVKLPASVKKILDKLLNPDATLRYTSGEELARAVRQALAEESPDYDVSTFRRWVESIPGVGGKPRKAGAKKKSDDLVESATGLVRRPYMGDGIHPKWVFAGLATLFVMALFAHLLESIFS
jgi:eukaryotic-like serine/threonine-protein kinase